MVFLYEKKTYYSNIKCRQQCQTSQEMEGKRDITVEAKAGWLEAALASAAGGGGNAWDNFKTSFPFAFLEPVLARGAVVVVAVTPRYVSALPPFYTHQIPN